MRKTTANSTYKKLAVKWLNEHLCFVSSSVLADSLVLRRYLDGKIGQDKSRGLALKESILLTNFSR
jgi:hypothetical protein